MVRLSVFSPPWPPNMEPGRWASVNLYTLTHCLAITQSRQEDMAIVHDVFFNRRKVKKEICKKEKKSAKSEILLQSVHFLK